LPQPGHGSSSSARDARHQLEEDGKLGPNSSQAVLLAFGHLLAGDPRAPEGGDPSSGREDS
jgi:hypothetical protein